MTMFGPEERREIEEFDPEGLQEMERREVSALTKETPEPSLADIIEVKDALEGDWHQVRFGDQGENIDTSAPRDAMEGSPGLRRIRDMRYHRDLMPERWRRMLNVPYRFRANLTGNEINRTTDLATRNPAKVKIKPAEGGEDAGDAAQKETRWANHLLEALTRDSKKPLLRIFFDSLMEAGFAAFEVYQTGSYDDLDLERDEDTEGDDFGQFNAQAETALKRALPPAGVRVLDPMTVMTDEDDHGSYVGVVVEHKPYRIVYERLRNSKGQSKLDELQLPRPGDSGTPSGFQYATGTGGMRPTVETIRYYDRRWYAYVVGGVFVTEPVRHGMPDFPILTSWGTATSSSIRSERMQGVSHGTVEMEQGLNDLITMSMDIGMTFGRPKSIIETPVEGSLRSESGQPTILKLDDPTEVPELMPGQKLRDAFEGFQSRIEPDLLQLMLGLRQASGLNPVSTGESPGADPSGFAINSLQSASQMRYESILDNGARTIGELIDFIRKMIKDGPISERWFLTIDADDGSVEYLGLGPEDITDVPSQVTIDPLNDVNRLAIRDSLMAGNQRGFIPRSLVQTAGYGAEDPEGWDDEILADTARAKMLGLAFDEALRRVSQQQPAPPSGLVGPDGQPIQSDTLRQEAGGAPEEPEGSTVGPEAAQASQAGLGDAVTSRASARGRGGQQPANQGVPRGRGA